MYPSAARLACGRLYTHVTRRLAGAPVRGGATPGAREGTVHFFVMANGATRHPHEHLRRRTADWGPCIRVQSWTVSLAIGSRCASGLRHHPRGKMLSAFVRATAASLAKSFVERLPSVAPRQGVMRPASRRTASLIAKRGWINAMDQRDGSPHSLSWSMCGVCKLRCCLHIDARVA